MKRTFLKSLSSKSRDEGQQKSGANRLEAEQVAKNGDIGSKTPTAIDLETQTNI